MGLEPPGNRRRRPGRGPLAVLAVSAAAGATAAVLVATGGFAGDARPQSPPTEGTATREVYSRAVAGQTREAVIALVGSPPIRTRRIVRSGIQLECIAYRRRSAQPGLYRFCFRGGLLWTKSAPPLGLAPKGR